MALVMSESPAICSPPDFLKAIYNSSVFNADPQQLDSSTDNEDPCEIAASALRLSATSISAPLSSVNVPPLNFAIVSSSYENGNGTLYRSGFPRPENYGFLDTLGLKTLLYLNDHDFKEDTAAWAKKHNIKILHFRVESNKEPLTETNKEEMANALRAAIVLIHCNRGRHRVGLLSALIRRLQNWSYAIIFDEYRKFFGLTEGVEGRVVGAGGGGVVGGFNGVLMRATDCEWIETFDLSQIKTDGEWVIDWARRPV